jgi:hypothetical protein
MYARQTKTRRDVLSVNSQHSKFGFESATMAREHYSLFYANSAHHEQRFLVSSRALQFAITVVETTPNVKSWSLVNKTATFMHDGKEREAHLPIAASMASGRRQLWQVMPGFGGALEQIAVDRGRAFAETQNCDHVLLTERALRERPTELLNRRTAHALLDHASQWNSGELEGYAVVCVRERARTLSQLQDLLKLSFAEQTHVVFIRAWLRGLVQWNIGCDRLTPNLLVEASRG